LKVRGSTLGIVKDTSKIPDPIPFPQVAPDGMMNIHDTPVMGTTAVLVQTGPGGHGQDLQYASYEHKFAIPYNQFTTSTPFVALGSGSAASDPPFTVACPYLQLQAMSVQFLKDGFAGNVPNVTGFPAPVRDYDGDTFLDSADTDVNNPNIH